MVFLADMNISGITFSLLMSMAFLAGCTSDPQDGELPYEIQIPINPTPKGERKFNVSPSVGKSGFPATFASMQEVGADLVELNLEWSYFEKEEGVYEDPDGLLQAVGFYADNDIDIGISLATINTVKRTDPPYLNDFSYDDPRYIASFTSLMEWILSSLPQRVKVDYISLGNEVNYFLKGEEWGQFRTFMHASIDHLRKQYPDIKYGAKTTISDGLLGDNRGEILSIIELSDVAMLNYYPHDQQFRVYEIARIEEQLIEVLQLVERDIYLTELGYQSGSVYCGSSEEKQAAFFHWMFNFWDAHDSAIPFIQVNWMHDIADENLEFYQHYYGSSDASFTEFLGTLGLKNHDETPKLAWEQVAADANARGWK